MDVKKYKREEALAEALKYFKGDELAADVWVNKYALKDSDNNFYELTPDDMHKRIAGEIARIESKYSNPLSYDEIYDSIKNFEYIVPQGSPMAGIGNNFQISSISNCFVIGPQKDKNGNYEDSYGSVLRNDQEIIQLSKRRAGVGITMEHVRPIGSNVKNAALSSTGVVPFMERFSNSIREVAQSGRRGALMISTHIKSMDSEAFINAKLDTSKVTGANISVKIDDEFMNALECNTKYEQKFPINSDNPILKKIIEPKIVWNKLIHNNWKSAEPGILFIDTILKESVADCYADQGFETVSVNPCGEITLCESDSCRLLLLNLYSYVTNPFTKNAFFDFDKFKKYVHMAQRYMDDIVDLELEKIDSILNKIESDPETDDTKSIEKNLWLRIKDKCIRGRRTGTGVTGEGDMLAALGLVYGTKEATDFATEVHKTLAINAYKSSVILAKERGAFPIFDFKKEINNPFVNRLYSADKELMNMTEKYGRRNIALLTISPAGSVSILTQTTSGIEPLFLPYYTRRRKINPNDKNTKKDFTDKSGDHWEEYIVFHHKLILWAELNGYDLSNVRTMDDDAINKIFEKSPYYNACANQINWEESVRMQGSIQRYVDHSISKTVNLPESTTVEMVDILYRTAWKSGCKGVTIYRDGSRSGVLVKKDEKKEVVEKMLKENNAPKRPKTLDCEVIRFTNKGEKWIGFVGLLDGRPYELFTGLADSFIVPQYVEKGKIHKVKHGDKDNIQSRYDFVFNDKDGYEISIPALNRAFHEEYWNTAKMISAVLRHGMPIASIINLIDSLKLDGDFLGTWKAGVKRMLKKYVADGNNAKDTCPVCGSDQVVFENACFLCKNCGNTKC